MNDPRRAYEPRWSEGTRREKRGAKETRLVVAKERNRKDTGRTNERTKIEGSSSVLSWDDGTFSTSESSYYHGDPLVLGTRNGRLLRHSISQFSLSLSLSQLWNREHATAQPSYDEKESLDGKRDLRRARMREPNDERRNSERRHIDETGERERESEKKENAFKLISVNYIRARTR